MSLQEAVVYDPGAVRLKDRIAAKSAVGMARLLATQSPRRIRAVLEGIRRGARPATFEQTLAARDRVVAVSLACAGRQGCVPRSIATALLCRIRGVWPTWCAGVRLYPFTAHAWVEADGHLVDEPAPPGYYTPTITVPPAPGRPEGSTSR